jgi:outer membrane protein assembly factor BamB
MPTDFDLRTIACPSCKAPLEISGSQRTVKCKYCGSVVEVPASLTSAPPITVKTPTYLPEMQSTRKQGPGLGLVVWLGVLVLAAGFGVWALQSGTVTLPSSVILIPGPAGLVPESGNPLPSVVVFTYDTETEDYALALLGGTKIKQLWRAAPFQESNSTAPVISSSSHVYTVDKAQLLAINVTDGSVDWDATLADEISAGCDGCLRLLNGHIVALTADGTLQGRDAQTGTTAWRFRLHDVSYHLLVIGGQPAVIDSDDEGNAALAVFDAADGTQIQSVSPTCGEDSSWVSRITSNASMAVDDANHALYIVVGTSPQCIQRWDTTTWQMTWSAGLPEELSTGWEIYSLLSANTLYLSDNDETLVAVDTSTGDSRLLAQNTDYALLPLCEQGNVLVARAKRTRGSQHFELWGIDVTSGQQIWLYDLADHAPIDPPDEEIGIVDDGEAVWTWQLVNNKLVVLQAQTKPSQLVVDTLDVANGRSTAQTTIPLSDRFNDDSYSVPDIAARQGDYLWLIVESNIYAVNLATGSLMYVWP